MLFSIFWVALKKIRVIFFTFEVWIPAMHLIAGMVWMSRLLHLLDTVIGILLTCGIIFCRHVRQQSGGDSWQARRRQRWKRYWEQCGQCVSRHRRRLVHSCYLSQGQRRHFPSWAGKVSLLYQVCLRLECKHPKRLSEMKTIVFWIACMPVA